MRGYDKGRKAFGMAHESPKVEYEEGARKASGVAETHEGPATEWAEESSRHRAPTPLEWPRGTRGTKLPEGTQRARADQGRTNRGGEGTKPPPPVEQPGRWYLTAAKVVRWAD